MGYNSRNTFKSTVSNDFVPGVDKWTGLEVQSAFSNMADSVSWESQKTVLSSATYDCSVGNLQEITLSGNVSLVISNPESGKYYTLIKKGAFTLALPTSQFTTSTATIPAGTAVLTFLYDGTNYFFSFAVYSNT
jgi:hypothetical protein